MSSTRCRAHLVQQRAAPRLHPGHLVGTPPAAHSREQELRGNSVSLHSQQRESFPRAGTTLISSMPFTGMNRCWISICGLDYLMNE